MRKVRRIGIVFLFVGLAQGVSACSDKSDPVTEDPLFAKTECPPGQADKGKCTPAPPPGPVEPNLPDPAPAGGPVTPNRIAVTPEGNLLVADPRTKSLVYVESGTLRPVAALKLDDRPTGVALLANRILVGNARTGAIDAFDPEDGSYLASFGTAALTVPTDLVSDEAAGLLFVSDSRNGRVFVFDSDGAFLRAISSKGTGTDQLFAPMGLALDVAAGEVLVSDWGDFGNADNATAFVKIFTYDGTYVTSISGEGTCGMMGCSGGFSRPGSPIFVNGKIFIPDVILAQVLVFDRATTTLQSALGGRPQLRLPTDLAVPNGTDLYVVNARTGEIVLFPGGAQ